MISLYNVCSILCYFIKVGIFFNQTFELQSSRAYVGAGGLKIMGVANQDADNNKTSGFFIVNLYVTSNINYPQKDAFALLSVFNISISECVFQHLHCANGELYIRSFSNQKWSEWKKVGA